MSKITKAFQGGKAFIGFLTGGDPSKEKTIEYILAMAEAGADVIEIGIPFSDPIAEGPVIQNANLRALSNEFNTDDVFEVVEEVRKNTNVPLAFLTYINPVFYYGYEKFFKRCNELDINGIIIPDLPYEEKEEILDVATKYDVDIISLIAPTSKKRIKTIAKDATGFIYLVSSMGVTGVRTEIKTDLKDIVNDIREVTNIPVSVGFGINTPEQAKEIAKIADGVIVGSAIVKIIEEHGYDAKDHIIDYVSKMKNATMLNNA
ncbi:tryptophan synthase alpha chain [Methanobrevibacter cuticularis]|uniref:Tryptophan synthase alpha chain n=1 Tax=Methanobrevibacter cuticularis TaxID=47311 RepID=A0A166CSG6_9EURY|nr:tryptophan synthase subunit alpha [Methanobrevibacter cuticularis]KZX14814.1 tryptophan synthase alpha chain [Methanobrevibacter cuticularis]